MSFGKLKSDAAAAIGEKGKGSGLGFPNVLVEVMGFHMASTKGKSMPEEDYIVGKLVYPVDGIDAGTEMKFRIAPLTDAENQKKHKRFSVMDVAKGRNPVPATEIGQFLQFETVSNLRKGDPVVQYVTRPFGQAPAFNPENHVLFPNALTSLTKEFKAKNNDGDEFSIQTVKIALPDYGVPVLAGVDGKDFEAAVASALEEVKKNYSQLPDGAFGVYIQGIDWNADDVEATELFAAEGRLIPRDGIEGLIKYLRDAGANSERATPMNEIYANPDAMVVVIPVVHASLSKQQMTSQKIADLGPDADDMEKRRRVDPVSRFLYVDEVTKRERAGWRKMNIGLVRNVGENNETKGWYVPRPLDATRAAVIYNYNEIPSDALEPLTGLSEMIEARTMKRYRDSRPTTREPAPATTSPEHEDDFSEDMDHRRSPYR